MTAESLLITYVQIGVAISGFSGIVVSLGTAGGASGPTASASSCMSCSG